MLKGKDRVLLKEQKEKNSQKFFRPKQKKKLILDVLKDLENLNFLKQKVKLEQLI